MIAVGTAVGATGPRTGTRCCATSPTPTCAPPRSSLIAWVLLLAPVYGEAGDAGNFAVAFASPLFCLILDLCRGPAVVPIRRSAWPVGLAALAVLTAITIAEMATALDQGERRHPVAHLACGWLPPPSCCSRRSRGAPSAACGRRSDDEPAAVRPRGTSSLIGAGAAASWSPWPRASVLLRVIGGRPQGPVQVVAAVSASIVAAPGGAPVRARWWRPAGCARLVDLGERQLRELAESTGDVVLCATTTASCGRSAKVSRRRTATAPRTSSAGRSSTTSTPRTCPASRRRCAR